MEKKIFLTGIKSNKRPHLGNYLGAMRPALELCQKESDSLFIYFIADYHALTTTRDGAELKKSTLEVAASWIACGLDPAKVILYRQSDIPEIFEMNWILGCHTPKGDLNRAHSYKDRVTFNQSQGDDPDKGINIGLFTYPVLMAADILLFQATHIPIGKDQKQHVEIARSMAQRINETYKRPLLREPKEVIDENTQIIPGLDGRKMSKSYDNTIDLFEEEKKLKKLINRIKTDSTGVDEEKDPKKSEIYSLYQFFATPEEIDLLRQSYREGISWGEAKAKLFEVVNREISPMREKYQDLLAHEDRLEEILQDGAKKARVRARETLANLRLTFLGR